MASPRSFLVLLSVFVLALPVLAAVVSVRLNVGPMPPGFVPAQANSNAGFGGSSTPSGGTNVFNVDDIEQSIADALNISVNDVNINGFIQDGDDLVLDIEISGEETTVRDNINTFQNVTLNYNDGTTNHTVNRNVTDTTVTTKDDGETVKIIIGAVFGSLLFIILCITVFIIVKNIKHKKESKASAVVPLNDLKVQQRPTAQASSAPPAQTSSSSSSQAQYVPPPQGAPAPTQVQVQAQNQAQTKPGKTDSISDEKARYLWNASATAVKDSGSHSSPHTISDVAAEAARR